VTAPLDSFRALATADATIRDALAAAAPDAFIETALALAARHGLALPPEALAPLTAPDPVFMVQHQIPPLRGTGWPPPGWLPFRLAADADGSPAVDWADFTAIPLDGRFHTEAVRAALDLPLNRLLRCRTPLAALLREPPEGLRAPDGFIFHMSRCGSTLVARMLAALPDSYAVNEPEPVGALLQAAPGVPETTQIAALRTMVGAFGRRPSRHWFLKLSAWPALALPLFRKAFPAVPWIFIHRDPAEVLASQMATRAPELEPGFTPSRLFGIEDGATLDPELYCARALARVCEAALAADGGLYVDHAGLPEAFFSAILPHFGLGADEATGPMLREIARRHGKHPDMVYLPANAAIDPAVRAAADAHLAPLHARLKAVRG
jgi:hypothetical protein